MKNERWRLVSRWLLLSRVSLSGNPVEVVLIVLFVLYGIVGYNCIDRWADYIYVYAPLLFMAVHVANEWTRQGAYRYLYYLSGLLLVPTVLWADPAWLWEPSWVVSLVILALLYWQVGARGLDVVFMRRLLRSFGAFALSILLSGVSFWLLLSVYGAIGYLFDVVLSSDYSVYVGIVIWAGLFPLLLLLFEQEENWWGGGKVLDVLSRFVLSPILFVYTLLFYAYMGKIAFTVSLPKGGVCLMVAAFVAVAFFLKGISPFLSGAYYRRFYDYLGWIVLPTLILYGIGAFYRINQYGWTLSRVYLVVVGVVMAVLWLMTILRRPGTYFYTAWAAVCLLALVTYVPGISAQDIERISQEGRGNDSSGRAITREYLTLEDHADHEVDGYRYFRSLEVWDNDAGDTICCGVGDSVWIRLEKRAFLRKQYAKVGLELSAILPDSLHSRILCFKTDSSMLLFERMRLYREEGKETRIELAVGHASYFWK